MSITSVSTTDSALFSGSAANVSTATSAAQSTEPLPSSLANLQLTQSQQQQIGQIVQNAQSGAISFSQVKSEITSVLNPSQVAQLKSEHHRHHHARKASGASSSSNDDSASSLGDEDTDAFGVPLTTQSISDVAASFSAQSQTNTWP